MIEQWISASRALVIAKDAAEIRDRASTGVVRARAKKLVEADEVRLNSPVPTALWKPAHPDEFQEDWQRGDFSATLEKGTKIAAYQVSFEIADVLSILPAHERATAARRASIVGDPQWVSASEAIAQMTSLGGIADTQAKASLMSEAGFGFVSAAAVLAEFDNELFSLGGRDWHISEQWAEREWHIEPWFWKSLEGASFSADWATGSFQLSGVMPVGDGTLRLSGVHFQKRELSELIGSGSGEDGAPRSKSKGGRPPLAFTDDLWAALCARLYLQDISSVDIKTISKIITQWADERGHSIGKDTADHKAARVVHFVREFERRIREKPKN